MVKTLTIRRPDDWHVHLRDGAMLRDTVAYTARQFARAIVMPNLTPPITTHSMARDYRARILDACPASLDFTPLMTAYLTEDCAIDDLVTGAREGVFVAAKLYPAGATTNSAQGVRDVERIYPVLEAMEREGLVLCVHGEVTDPHIDIFDREAVFIERHLAPILARFPELRIVFEHITTREAVDFVEGAGENLAATITPHHLHINRNAMFEGGLRPHAYCLPVAKRETHRLALRRAATSGNPKFFLGTDSAPHFRDAKESDCGCAGIFNAPHALESYLEVFDEEGALDRFEAFTSLNGPNFYRLPVNDARITLVREPVEVERVIHAGGGEIVPFHSGERLSWRLAP